MYFDDFKPADSFTTGTRTVTESEIIDFAKQWDRQYFHLDAEAAKDSIYGGLIASGFHTLLITFDLVIDTGICSEGSRGSPGMETLKWLRPVRPGDTLQVEFQVVEATPSRKRDDQGYILLDYTTRNQQGEAVLTFRSTWIIERKLAEES
ncbi:MAG: MaoC family dehydratase [Pseudomonadota bacterium]